jgi:hypothetical protein
MEATIDSEPPGALIPVLMRLPDVRPPSRGKSKRPPATGAKELPKLDAKEALVASSEEAVRQDRISEALAASVAAGSTAASSSTAPHPSPQPERPKSDSPPVVATSPDVATSPNVTTENVSERSVAAALAVTNATDTGVSKVTASESEPEASAEPDPTSTPASAPAGSRRQRQRRSSAEPKPSWWRSQGRVLAVVFVVLLAVTIFVAKGRGPKAGDTARENETPSDIEISSTSVADDSLDAVRPVHATPSPTVVAAPPLAATSTPDDDMVAPDVMDEEALEVVANGDQAEADLDEPPADDEVSPYAETDPSTYRFPRNAALDPSNINR